MIGIERYFRALNVELQQHHQDPAKHHRRLKDKKLRANAINAYLKGVGEVKLLYSCGAIEFDALSTNHKIMEMDV